MTQAAGLSSFRNIQGAPTKDYVIESIGGGCAFLDYDGDGRIDILLVRGTTLERLQQGGDSAVALYRNSGDGTFTDVTERAKLTAQGWGMGVTVADYDNDGRPDALVTGFGGNFLFRNEGDGTFSEKGATAGIRLDGRWSTGAAFGDLDADGDLDLYIAGYVDLDLAHLPKRGSGENCSYKGLDVFCGPRGLTPAPDSVFRNDGNGKFTDVTRAWGLADAAPPFYGLQVLIADYANDGRADIFVANDSTPNFLFHNEGKGRFQELGIQTGVAVNLDGREQASMGADWGDYDNDGRLDLFVTNFSEDANTLYRNLPDGAFSDVSWATNIGGVSWPLLGWGVKFFDYDNDARLDIIVANGHVYPEADQRPGGAGYKQQSLLHRNLGNGTFEEVAGGVLTQKGTARGLAVGDYDDDGDLDVLINNQDAGPTLVRNDTPSGNHWLQVVLKGKTSNSHGVGATVTVLSNGKKQTAAVLAGDSYLSSSDTRLHFGLGEASRVQELTVKWPSGKIQNFSDVAADETLIAEEP